MSDHRVNDRLEPLRKEKKDIEDRVALYNEEKLRLSQQMEAIEKTLPPIDPALTEGSGPSADEVASRKQIKVLQGEIAKLDKMIVDKWTHRENLRKALDQIEAGTMNPEGLVVKYLGTFLD
jgi:predicted RNase H-like nuclease (RuvC/YqgF family)